MPIDEDACSAVPHRRRSVVWLAYGVGAIAMVVSACSDEGSNESAAVSNDQLVASCIGIGDLSVEPTLCVVDVADGTTTEVLVGITAGVPPALSHDRRRIAVEIDGHVRVVDLDGRQLSEVDASADSLSWVGDTESLVLQRTLSEQRAIELHDLGTDRAPSLLVDPEGLDAEIGYGIDVSPNGMDLAFVIHRSDRWELIVMKLNDGQQHVMLSSTEPISLPAWSPDSATLAVVVGDTIRSVDTRTGADAMLVIGPQPVTTPTWSPDGVRIAYVDSRGALATVPFPDGSPKAIIVDLTANLDERSFPALPVWT